MKTWMAAVAAVALLAVGVPLVAWAVITEGADDPAPAEATSIDIDSTDSDASAPAMTQQRLRVHAETGPPEGFDPIRQRLHQHQDGQTGQMGGQGTGRQGFEHGGRGPGWQQS